MNLNDRLRSSLPWLLCSKTLVQGISLLSTLTVARLLAPENYGVMALSAFWTSSLLTVSELGAGAAIIQFQGLEKRELNALFGFTTGLSLVGYILLFLLAPFIGDWFASEQLVSVLRVAGLALPIATLRVVPEGLLRKQLRFDLIAKANIVASVLAIPVVLSCALAGAGVWALVASALVSALAQTFLIFRQERWRPSLAMGSDRLDRLLHFCVHAFGGRMCWAIYQQLDVVLLGKFGGAASVGVYSMAMQLITFPIDKVFSVVNEFAHPAMAHIQDDAERVRISFLKSLRIVALLAFPMYVGLAFVAEDLIRIILTDTWSESAAVLQLLTPYGLLSSIAVLIAPVLLARYRADLVFRYTFAQLLIMPPAFWLGARYFGAHGVAMAWVLMYPLALSWLVTQLIGEIQIAWLDIWVAVKPAMNAVACMGVALEAVRVGVLYTGGGGSLLALILAVLTGIMTYILGLWIFGRTLLQEMIEMSRALIQREPSDEDKHSVRE